MFHSLRTSVNIAGYKIIGWVITCFTVMLTVAGIFNLTIWATLCTWLSYLSTLRCLTTGVSPTMSRCLTVRDFYVIPFSCKQCCVSLSFSWWFLVIVDSWKLLRAGSPTASNSVRKICGNQSQQEVYSTGSSLFVKFHSDGGITGRGFHLVYEAVPAEPSKFE